DCKKKIVKLSRNRLLGHAGRPERLVKLGTRDKTVADGSIGSVSRLPHSLRIEVRLSPKAMRMSEPILSVLGRDEAGALRCATMRLPARSSRVKMVDSASLDQGAVAQYRGNAFIGQLTIPISRFLAVHPIFVKLERRSWFFDVAGRLDIQVARSILILLS